MCIIQQSFYRFSMWAWLIWIFARHAHHFINISATIQITVVMITTTTTIYDIKQQQHLPSLPPLISIPITITTKQCAKCGDIHSAFNGNGNYCKSAQAFELYLCINTCTYTYVCIVCVVLLRYVEPLNSVAIQPSNTCYQQSTVCSSHDRFRETFVASV